MSTREERLDLLQAILSEYQKRSADLGEAVTEEMGAPPSLGSGTQVYLGLGHLSGAIDALKNFEFEVPRGAAMIFKEPIGVCGLITPWNWPINQIACKVFPALATGCTMVLKPSEVAPYSGTDLHRDHGCGRVRRRVSTTWSTATAPASAPRCRAIPTSTWCRFTGSTRAGIDVARNAAATVKRVTQELGGKSPNIVLDDDDFAQNVAVGVAAMMPNSGQTL